MQSPNLLQPLFLQSLWITILKNKKDIPPFNTPLYKYKCLTLQNKRQENGISSLLNQWMQYMRNASMNINMWNNKHCCHIRLPVHCLTTGFYDLIVNACVKRTLIKHCPKIQKPIKAIFYVFPFTTSKVNKECEIERLEK